MNSTSRSHRAAAALFVAGLATTSTSFALQGGYTAHPETGLRGMFQNAPTCFVLQTGSGASTTHQMRVSEPAAPPSSSIPWSTTALFPAGPDYPDYSLDAIEDGLDLAVSQSILPSDLRLGGVSAGSDLIPGLDEYGVVEIPVDANGDPRAWWAASVTVGGDSSTSYGLPNNDTWTSLTDPRFSVVTYYHQGNGGIASTHVDKLTVEHIPSEWGLTPSSTTDIVGIDQAMGVISYDPNEDRSSPLVHHRHHIFFTLTKEWTSDADALLTTFAVPSDVNHVPDPATVYRMDWGSLTGGGYGWRDLSIAFTRAELFPTGHQSVEDDPTLEIDGLSVDFFQQVGATSPSRERVIFSVAPYANQNLNPAGSELMIYSRAWTTTTEAVPARVATSPTTSVTLASKLGLKEGTERDNVNGICTLDPPESVYSRGIGTPRSPELSGPPTGNIGIAVACPEEPVPTAQYDEKYLVTASGLVAADYPSAYVVFQVGGIVDTDTEVDPMDTSGGWVTFSAAVLVPGTTNYSSHYEYTAPTGSGGTFEGLAFRTIVIDAATYQALAASANSIVAE